MERRATGIGVVVHAAVVLVFFGVPTGFWPPIRIVIVAGSLVGMMGGLLLLRGHDESAWYASVGFVGSMLLAGILLLGGRLGFILEHRAMDIAEPPGSPAAFLIGAAVEQVVVTVPAALLATRLWLEHRSDAA